MRSEFSHWYRQGEPSSLKGTALPISEKSLEWIAECMPYLPGISSEHRALAQTSLSGSNPFRMMNRR